MKLNKFFGLCVLASSIALAGCGGDKKAEQAAAPADTD